MVRLEVNARIRHEEQTLHLDEGQDLLHIELALELSSLRDILQSTLVKLDLLLRHDAASDVALGSVVEALRHA